MIKTRILNTLVVPGVEQATPIVTVMDHPGAGGGCHRYDVTGFDTAGNPSSQGPDGYRTGFSRMVVIFQNGAPDESGLNGVTMETLLAISEDRLKGFVAGPYNCAENDQALFHIKEALGALNRRTARVAAERSKALAEA